LSDAYEAGHLSSDSKLMKQAGEKLVEADPEEAHKHATSYGDKELVSKAGWKLLETNLSEAQCAARNSEDNELMYEVAKRALAKTTPKGEHTYRDLCIACEAAKAVGTAADEIYRDAAEALFTCERPMESIPGTFLKEGMKLAYEAGRDLADSQLSQRAIQELARADAKSAYDLAKTHKDSVGVAAVVDSVVEAKGLGQSRETIHQLFG
jgi:hypothetical protein